jgi:lysosomal acid lipase/cholesteryl ester hydrolase
VTNIPSGAGILNYFHYGQLIVHEAQVFQRFDYENEQENMDHYGQIYPPDYDLKSIDFPIALFGGDVDPLADSQDVHWLNEQLGDKVSFYNEYHLAHETFLVAKDMSYFTVDVMAVLKTKHGHKDVCDSAFDSTSFSDRHEFCANIETVSLI